MAELLAKVQRPGAGLGFWERAGRTLLIRWLAVAKVVIPVRARTASASWEAAQP